MRRSAVVTAALFLAAPLTGCGEDAPVCQSVDGLQDSIADVRDVDLSADEGPGELKAALQQVQADLDAVKSDAADEYSDQISAMRSAFTNLQSNVKDTQEGAATVSETAAAVATFGTAVETFVEDLRTTC